MCVALILACLFITKAHGNYRDEKERGSIVLQLLYPCFWTCAYVCLFSIVTWVKLPYYEATIGSSAKRHLNVVSLERRLWLAFRYF